MLIVTIPKTTAVGDSVEATINGEKRTLQLAYDSIMLDEIDRREIQDVMEADDANQTLICSDADDQPSLG